MKSIISYLPHTLRKWNVHVLAILVALGLGVCCSSVFAQSGAGSIQGTVTDATGAVIQAASIHVVQQGTNLTFDTKSSGVGFYQVPSLFTGTYDVTISAPGFKSYKTTIELLVAQNAVINPSLTAGAVTQQVQVAGNLVQLTTTDSGTLSSTLENARINQLPMNGRYLLTLAGETTPGLEAGGTGGGAGQRLDGLMQGAIEYVADGVPLSDPSYDGQQTTTRQTPDPDSVQEFRIETSGSGAQFATPATGILTTKSGTNRLHGSLFETARNNGLGLARTRQNPSNFTAPQLVRNEYGASVGGPIIVPHVYHGKDKSFWFFAWEKYSLVQNTYNLHSVPTTVMRNGDFSGLVNKSGVLLQLYDPATTQSAAHNWARTPFTKNQIPITRESPTAKVFMDITPAPTTTDNPLVEPNYNALNLNNTQVPNYTFRLDHTFNDNNRAYLRNTIIFGTSVSGVGTVAADGIPARTAGISPGGVSHPSTFYASAAGFTHVFSPTFFSETVASMEWINHRYVFSGNYNANYESQLGLPNNFGEAGFPNDTSLIFPLTGDQNISWVSAITTDIDENLTKTVGKHQMQFGGRYRRGRFGIKASPSVDTIANNGYATALENPASGANYATTPNTGYADADEFLGAASSYTINLSPPYQHAHDMEFDAYFQDGYHVSRNLTVDLGLRYEAHPAPWMKYGLMQSFDFKNDAMVLASSPSNLISEGYTTQAIITNDQNDGAKIETPQEAGMNSTLLRNYDFTVGPRVGLAYQPFGGKYGTVLRGAYGRYIYPEPVQYSLRSVGNNNPFVASYSQSYTTAAQSPDDLPNYLLRAPQTATGPLSAGTPIMGVNSAGVVDSSTTNSILPGIAVNTTSYDDAPNYVTEVNATVEQPLKGNSALRISWVWSHGTNLNEKYFWNQHPTNYTWEMQTGIVPPTGKVPGTDTYSKTATGPYDKTTWNGGGMMQKTGWSTDNSLKADYQRLYHHGIAYQISYVWSKPFRVGGNAGNDELIYPAQDYVNVGNVVSTMTSPYGTVIAPALPPARPAGVASYASYHALARFESYRVDSAIPKHHIQFNGIFDLPFGRGKRFLGNANRLLNELVGGFQLAGDGSVASEDFPITATNWGPTNPLVVYKHKASITDCRSGVCRKAFEWFNGYLAPTVVNNPTNGVTGLPGNWAPYQTPIDTSPTSQADPTGKYYGQNEVSITLPGGKPTAIAYAPSTAATSTSPVGANPFAHTILNGPFNYTTDLSVFKIFPITEGVFLRFNVDAFNALNVQGYNNPNATDGTEQLTSSHNSPRQLQLTLRLTF